MTREECEQAVRRPGKFENEPVYVPYFWDAYLNGMADRDDGETIAFNITAEDRTLFPELAGRRTVCLRETSQGFVTEVQS